MTEFSKPASRTQQAHLCLVATTLSAFSFMPAAALASGRMPVKNVRNPLLPTTHDSKPLIAARLSGCGEALLSLSQVFLDRNNAVLKREAAIDEFVKIWREAFDTLILSEDQSKVRGSLKDDSQYTAINLMNKDIIGRITINNSQRKEAVENLSRAVRIFSLHYEGAYLHFPQKHRDPLPEGFKERSNSEKRLALLTFRSAVLEGAPGVFEPGMSQKVSNPKSRIEIIDTMARYVLNEGGGNPEIWKTGDFTQEELHVYLVSQIDRICAW